MGNISLRGLDNQVKMRLKAKAVECGSSVNSLILSIIHKGIGMNPSSKRIKHHDLDSLAGSWSDEEMNEFLDATSDFSKIDNELWK